MAATTNPLAGHSNGNNNNNGNGNTNGGGQENKPNGGTASSNAAENKPNGGTASSNAAENSVVGHTQASLRHNPGLSLDWTPEEQSTLEDLLSKYVSDANIVRYAKIAQSLKDKTVRDIALRCKWMIKKDNGKRKKDGHNSSRKNKDKKEKVSDSLPKSSQVVNCSNGPPYAQAMMSMDCDDGISYEAIGGAAGQLLEQNSQALDLIFANFSAFKIHENINLFCQARTTILSILNDLHEMPEIMKQMPPLPVKLNEELACSILPPTSLSNKS